ncbi:MAG: hypothetical protein M3137_15875 [Actinomycetota bacterium]|nr:hypothetical protein [Actinomycetota bacterium]
MKRGETPADDDLLRHEGWILALAAHPGVVALCDAPRSTGPTVLRTRAVRGRPLAVIDELSPAEVAGLGAAAATIVADLHDVGLTHGALHADHILVSPTGRPVLCGFSAARASAPPRHGSVGDAATDVATLGRALVALLPRGRQAETCGPLVDAGRTSALIRLLDGVSAGPHPESARRLAERLGDGRFASRLPARGSGVSPPRRVTLGGDDGSLGETTAG